MAQTQSEDSDKMELKCLIGEGAFGKVFLMEDQKGKQVALKVVQLLGRHIKEIMQTVQEVELLATLEHENILKYITCSENEGTLYIVTEYCPNGDLQEYIKEHTGTAMEERRLVYWIKQVISALKYLHELPKPVIHRDLKTANIFLDGQWNTKMGDFGIARVLQAATDFATTQCGTLLYMSPEVFQGIPYSDKTDIFSLGIMMYEMTHMDKVIVLSQLMLFKIIHGSVPTMPTKYSNGVTEVLALMIKNDPKDRPSASELLEHNVFKTTPLPNSIPPRVKSNKLNAREVTADEKQALVGTLKQLHAQVAGQRATGGGAAMLRTINEQERTVVGNDEYEDNPIMQHVSKTLTDMGIDTGFKGKSALEKQAKMLKLYCLQCLDKNEDLFTEACRALDADQDEEEIEETLIRILGHERYGLCGLYLLYYKNFSVNLRKK